MDHAKKGADALAASDANAAVEHYTKALIEHSSSPDYFVQRSIAFTRLKPPRHDLALQDADFATLCGQKRGKRDKIMDGQQRRVVSLYNSERYADAKFILDTMQKWRPENNKKSQMEHAMWKAKIDSKIQTAASQDPTVTEYPSSPLPEEKDLKKLLQKQLKADGSFNYDGEEVPEAAQDVTMTDDAAPTTTKSNVPTNNTPDKAPTPVSAPSSQAPQNIRHEWYQNNTTVIVTVYAKGVNKDSAEIDIEDDSVSISFPHPSDTSSTFNLSFDPLHALVDSSQSKHRVLSTKIEITLAKATPGQKWPALEGLTPLKATTDPASTAPTPSIPASVLNPSSANAAPSYPTSSKSGPKNWDKLATELTAKKPKKPKKKADDSKNKDENAESDSEGEDDAGYESDMGGDEVDGFFKKLYAGADPDTRRAMMKSFTESNGTALSTNWAEVGSKRVEVVKGKDEED